MEEPVQELTARSYFSKASIQSQQTLDSVALRSQMKIYRMQANLDENDINNAWTGFGMYICKSLRQGRAVQIPKFGLFTFSNRDVNLEGTTNEFDRDKDVREPVFIVAKDFAKGLDLKPSVYRTGILRPLVLSSTSGRIQQILCSFQEVAQLIQLEKESVKYSVERIIRNLEDRIREGEESVQMIIPSVGTWIYKKGQVCVKFQDFIKKDITGLLKLDIDDRRKKNLSNLTSSALRTLQDSQKIEEGQSEKVRNATTYIDDDAREYMQSQLQIDNNKFEDANNNYEGDVKIQSILQQGTQDAVAQSQTKDAYKKEKKLIGSTDEEQAFDQWKFLLRTRSLKPYDLFSSMIGHIYGIQGTDRRTLNLEQFNKCMVRFDVQPENERDIQLIFKFIDSKKDKQIDLEEWSSAFINKKEQQALEQIKDVIRKNNLSIEDLLQTMGIANIKENEQISLDDFKKAIYKLNLTKYLSDLAAKQLFKENNVMLMKDIINELTSYKAFNQQSSQLENTSDQKQSQDSIDGLLKKIKQELNKQFPIQGEQSTDQHYQYLIKEFEKYDLQNSGSVDFSNFKTCLLKANLGLSLDEIGKISRHADQTESGQINYGKFSKKVNSMSVHIIYQLLQQVNNSLRKKEDVDNLPHLAEQIKRWLKHKSQSVEDLLTLLLEKKENRKATVGQDQKKLRISAFANSISDVIGNINLSDQNLQLVSESIDIDKDGYIDKYDLETFINRYTFIQDSIKESNYKIKSLINSGSAYSTPLVLSRSMSGTFNLQPSTVRSPVRKGASLHQRGGDATKIQESKLLSQSVTRLYPTATADTSKIDAILKQLKRVVAQKRITFFEVFKTLDSNGDGFVNFGEFEENIGKIIQLSTNAKEGLFAYLDNLKIGFFDFQRLSFVVSKLNLPPEQIHDNWEWQHDILKKIREWKESNGLTEEQAFKVVDGDFDGFISKEDLRKFLAQQFKILDEKPDSTRLDRLFKLLDEYKKGFVQKHDFAKIFSGSLEDVQSQQTKTRQTSLFSTQADQFARTSQSFRVQSLTPFQVPVIQVKELGQTHQSLLKPKKNLNYGNTLQVEDWMINCCQQLALSLSKNFSSLQESYEYVSGNQNKLTYEQFKQYIERNNILIGFNLTENLLKQLFAFIDPHKKGFLTSQDWVSSLQIYKESQDVPLSDLQDIIYFTFKSSEEAFQFFKLRQKNMNESHLNKGEIYKDQFITGLKNLFSQVYTEAIYLKLWEKTHLYLRIPIEQPLSVDNFSKLYPRVFPQNSRYQSRKKLGVANIEEQRFSDNFQSNSLSTNNLISYNNFSLSNDIVNTFRNLVLSKGINLQEVFQASAISDQVTNCEFKNILMKLKLGLSSKDIDYILVFADPTSPAQINWKQFITKLKFSDPEQLLINRSRGRMQQLKECLYGYLISPKDAFLEFDKHKKGVMTLEDFRFFLTKVAILQRSDVPSYSISKDMFDQIDIKKDGIIDIDEWQQAFMQYSVKGVGENLAKERERDRISFSKFHKKRFETLNPIVLSDSPFALAAATAAAARSCSIQKPRGASTQRDSSPLTSTWTSNICDVAKNNIQTPLVWERSSEYDQTLFLIARNRKYLLSKFDSLKSDSKEKSLLPEQVKQILKEFLATYNIKPSDQKLDVLSNFAIKSGKVNYDFMIDIFKNRFSNKNNPPK